MNETEAFIAQLCGTIQSEGNYAFVNTMGRRQMKKKNPSASSLLAGGGGGGGVAHFKHDTSSEK